MQISVIIPIYNAEKYLAACIESVISQTYQDLQIILADDGSEDDSLQICDRYAGSDPRIQVLHKENGGLVSARKMGVQSAAGEFIGWVDADDWVEPGYFEQMVRAQKESGADIVAAGHFHDIGAYSSKVFNSIPAGIYSSAELLPRLMYSGKFFEYGLQPHVYTKLMRREILQKTQLRVDERICAGEDAAVVYPSVLEAEKICITDICGYHYVQHQGSITKTEKVDELERFLILAEYLEDIFWQKGVAGVLGPQLRQYKKYFLFLRQMQVLDQRVLLPYGGIPLHSRVILYGAGSLGQKMYRYLSGHDLAEIILWVDKNYSHYQRMGLRVEAPECIGRLEKEYDYILIAHTAESVADVIRGYLKGLDVPESKIRWFTGHFINGCFLPPVLPVRNR